MKRKRFKHQVHIFCHMFCGWQIVNDLDRLLDLEGGILKIDVLKNISYHNETEVSGITISDAIHDWFISDLLSNNIDEKDIDEACLVVDFSIQKDRKNKNIRHEFRCAGILTSGENRYLEEYEDLNGTHKITNTEQCVKANLVNSVRLT